MNFRHLTAALLLVVLVGSNKLLAQTTFSYSGSTVTVDGTSGFEDALTIDVPTSSFTSGNVLYDINLSITYDKTDGSCASVGTGDSWHEEHGFQLQSPIGTQVTIFSTGTFGNQDDISPGVTQVFDDESTTAIPEEHLLTELTSLSQLYQVLMEKTLKEHGY